MNEITLTINGKQVQGKQGDTVLDVCRTNGIKVPTLCHMEGLSDVGACRLCLVDVERERRSVPACTYPARDGLSVKTSTPDLEKRRRLILELIFTERNHYCMFCTKSGDCELQNLAYEYSMDHVRYPYAGPILPVDAVNEHLVIDHNRCILCGRCVRVCDEIAGIRVLEPSKRGWKAMIAADLGESIGESSCISCGACVQACPTGAITSKLSPFKGKRSECQEVDTVCPLCGISCRVNVLVKDNNLVRIESPDVTNPTGALCMMGRFWLLSQMPSATTSPMIRRDGRLEACSMESAIGAAAEKLTTLGSACAGIVSARYPNETLALFKSFMQEAVGSDWIDTLDGEDFRTIDRGLRRFYANGNGLDMECSIGTILEADCIIVVGADPLKTHPVIGSLIGRAVGRNGAKLIVIDGARNVFPRWTDIWLRPRKGTGPTLVEGLHDILATRNPDAKERTKADPYKTQIRESGQVSAATGIQVELLERALYAASRARRATIIYGSGVLDKKDPAIVTSLLRLADLMGSWVGDTIRVISLKRQVNSRGAWDMGLAKQGIEREWIKGLYMMVSDEEIDGRLLDWAKKVDFLVVQASRESPLTDIADVVLPSPAWPERTGTCKSMDGKVLKMERVLQPQDGLFQDGQILAGLSRVNLT